MRASFCLTLLLAVQLAFSGLALGAAASHPPLDAYGNPICAAGAEPDGSHPAPGNHSRIPECCQLGCPMLGGVGLLPPQAPGLDAPLAPALEAAPPPLAPWSASKDEWRPGNQRAPPRGA